jgi:hypothetical protein
MESETFIDTLILEQKQAAFDLLWQRLAAEPRALNSPAWHGDVLAYRKRIQLTYPTCRLPRLR